MATIDFRVSDDSSTLSYWASANMEDGNPNLIAFNRLENSSLHSNIGNRRFTIVENNWSWTTFLGVDLKLAMKRS